MDILRPEVSFQKAIQRRIDTQMNPPTVAPQDNIVSNQAQATVPTPKPFNEAHELAQVNVLYSFLENRYTKKVKQLWRSYQYAELSADIRSVSIIGSYDEATLQSDTLWRPSERVWAGAEPLMATV